MQKMYMDKISDKRTNVQENGEKGGPKKSLIKSKI